MNIFMFKHGTFRTEERAVIIVMFKGRMKHTFINSNNDDRYTSARNWKMGMSLYR
jgi:hypothetical protein